MNREMCQKPAARSRRSRTVTAEKCTKSVIHVQSCCFANSGVCVAVAVAVAQAPYYFLVSVDVVVVARARNRR